jgi:hypothetical protein
LADALASPLDEQTDSVTIAAQTLKPKSVDASDAPRTVAQGSSKSTSRRLRNSKRRLIKSTKEYRVNNELTKVVL